MFRVQCLLVHAVNGSKTELQLRARRMMNARRQDQAIR